MNSYIPTIGIEVHLELKTKSKIFSPSKNSYENVPNINVNEIDLGYPGVLPTVNKEVINVALVAALGLNCKINKVMHFDRKNYFYPDLPKGYQITQNMTPIGYDGYIDIGDKKIEIERIHIEEDTAKSLHNDGVTLLNYNRSGVPLVEIVTKPVIHSSEDAVKYLEALRELMLYLGVSDCKIEEGSMRADVNVSVSSTDKLGTKCEVKNIGSISNVGLAIDSEIKRHIEILESGEEVEEETRRFDSKRNITVTMRKKEVGNEYRYLPEPDIPYLYLTDEDIEKAKEKLNLLPEERRKIYHDRGILDINIDKLINNKELSDYLNNFIDTSINFKIASNLLLGEISSYLNKKKVSIFATKLTKDKFTDLVTRLDNGSINNNIFKQIYISLLEEDKSLDEILSTISLDNDINLEDVINKVLSENESVVNDYKSGKEKAFKFLMGMVMKETKGSANPKDVNDMLSTLLK